MADLVPAGIEKVKRSQFVTYLDTTPTATAETWAVLGVGIPNYGISYGPSVDSEKWIIEDTARQDHTANQKQGSVTQKIYKNDPCFEFVAAGRDQLNYVTHILDIDRWNGTDGTYPAKKSDGLIAITQWMDEDATVQFDLYYNGDPIEGSVTITDGKPVFTPKA